MFKGFGYVIYEYAKRHTNVDLKISIYIGKL